MTLVRRSLALLLVLPAVGCVSRSEMDAVKAQLDTCERDKVAAQKSSSHCDARLGTESKRWDAIESQLTTSLPQTLKDFQDERTKIIQLVPEQVRKEVGSRLDRYFVNVSKQFDRMEGKMEGLREALDASRTQVAELAAATKKVGSKVDETHEAVVAEHAKSGELRQGVGSVVTQIVEFDKTRINCEKCKDRIKLKGNGREQLLAFHADLIKRIQDLQGTTAAATH
jgi:chromosome segregation ATPase